MIKNETGFDRLARLINQEGEDIREELGGRIDRLEYKVDEGVNSIRADMKSFRTDITELQESSEKHDGYTKEIDHVLQRTIAVEGRLGIKHSAREE